jgi:hypothetical protein
MLSWVTAPFACIFLGLIGFAVCDYFKERDFKKMEKEMKERGMDEESIAIARWCFTSQSTKELKKELRELGVDVDKKYIFMD